MTITLDLPHELERELAAEAARHGLSLSEYAVRILATGRLATEQPKTGAALVNYWEQEGLLGTRPASTDSAVHARGLREHADHRVRE